MNKSHTLLIFLLLFSALPLTAQDMITIKEDAPIHSEPNRNSRVLAFGIAGDQAEVIRFEDGFYRIRYESFGFTYEGYIHPSAVEGKNRRYGLNWKNLGLFQLLHPHLLLQLYQKQPLSRKVIKSRQRSSGTILHLLKKTVTS